MPTAPDDSDVGWGERSAETDRPDQDAQDDLGRWLQDERPPHHDRD